MRLLFSILTLALVVGCSTGHKPARASGLYLDYVGQAGHGVVGPVVYAMPFYHYHAGSNDVQISVSKIREDDSVVDLAFIYSISLGDVATGPVDELTFSKSKPTTFKLLTGVEVTGKYER